MVMANEETRLAFLAVLRARTGPGERVGVGPSDRAPGVYIVARRGYRLPVAADFVEADMERAADVVLESLKAALDT